MRLSAHLNVVFDEGQFRNGIEQIAAAGFDGIEMYGFERNHSELLEKCRDHGLEWIYLSGEWPDFTDPANHEIAIERIQRSLRIADEIGCEYVNVKSGTTQQGLDDETQRRSVIEILRTAAPVAEEYGITLVLEPLNATVDHPGHFTTTVSEGADIVAAVDSTNVKVLFDFYHEQISAGDLIRTFRETVDHVGHVHIADNPGRHEPGTGEINYRQVLEAIEESKYDGYVGCEFVPKGDPNEALRGVRNLL